MYIVRRSVDRGAADHGWLKSWHTFSFADYHDPQFMGFRALRVINEDRIAPSRGFATHPHRDMEIITYVISGALRHQDSMGNSTVIRPDEVQRMSAGSGIKHSEYNVEETSETHLLQIWIIPEQNDLTPTYGQKSFADAYAARELVLVVSRDGGDGSISIHQDVNIYVGKMRRGGVLPFSLPAGRHAWLQIVKGGLAVAEHELGAGDGVAVTDEREFAITARPGVEFLLFDLA